MSDLGSIPLEERAELYRIARERGLLSGRQKTVILYWSKGFGVAKTASLLGLHESTVRTFRARALRVLEAYVARPPR